MQKSFLKQEFEEFKITKAEGLHTGYDKFQKILSQMNTLKVRPKNKDLNLKFLRALPPSWSQVTLGTKTTMAYEDLKQIEKLDLEELDLKWQMAMLSIRVQKFEKKAGRKIKFNGQEAARFDKKLVQCYKCSQKGHFARECRAKASQDSQRYSAYKTQNARKKTDDSQALISVDTFINWQDHEDAHADEGALKIYGMIAGMESDPDSERKATSEYALMGFTTDKEMKFALHSSSLVKAVPAGRPNYPIPVTYGRTNNTVRPFPSVFKPNRPNTQSASPSMFGKRIPRTMVDPIITIDSSKDPTWQHKPVMAGSLMMGNRHRVREVHTIATQKTQPTVPKTTQTVDPSCAQHVKPPRQPIRTPVTSSPIPLNNRQNWNQRMQRDLGAGYSFERKPCFVCGSLSHLIKNCDYYEKKMAREAAFKSTRVIHANVRQATPAWTNSNRVNKANQFNPRPVNVRPNLSTASNTIKTGRVNVNTGNGNVNSASVHVNAGTQVKSGTSRFNTGKQHVNSGSVYVNSVAQIKSAASRVNTGKRYFNSGCDHINTARVNRPVSNKTSPKPSQVKFNSQNKCFTKQSSPVNRPFSRNTAYKSNIYAVKGKMGTAVKTSAGCVWRKTTPLSNTNSGQIPDSYDHPLKHMEHRGIFDSGCSGHMTGNRAHLEDYQELSKVGSVTFGGSKGSISGKGHSQQNKDRASSISQDKDAQAPITDSSGDSMLRKEEDFIAGIAKYIWVQPHPVLLPTPSPPVPTPPTSHVHLTQPQSTPPSITQPPPTITQPVQSSSTPPQSSSVQPTFTTPPIQPVETTSSPPMFSHS
ncbi:ribonuclease H-like domain-containing protein [Tanacetum coccineum]